MRKHLALLAAGIAALIIPVTAVSKPTPQVACGTSDCLGGGPPICQDWNLGAHYYANGHGWVCVWGYPDYWAQIF